MGQGRRRGPLRPGRVPRRATTPPPPSTRCGASRALAAYNIRHEEPDRPGSTRSSRRSASTWPIPNTDADERPAPRLITAVLGFYMSSRAQFRVGLRAAELPGIDVHPSISGVRSALTRELLVDSRTRSCDDTPRTHGRAGRPDAGVGGPAAAPEPDRRRRHLPQSDLHQVVRRLQQEDRRADQLPVDRLRRRHPPVHRGHGGLRRQRRPDERVADRGGERQRAPRAHRARRRRGDLQPARRSATPSSSSTATRWSTSSWAGSPSGTTSELAALNPGVKLPDLDIIVVHRSDGSGTTLHLHRLPQQVLPRVEGQGRATRRRSTGRSGSAARATRASPSRSSRPRAPSATSS